MRHLWDPTALQGLVKLFYNSKILDFATLKVKRTVRIKNRFKIILNRLSCLAELFTITKYRKKMDFFFYFLQYYGLKDTVN
jgi:hypothetical protein